MPTLCHPSHWHHSTDILTQHRYVVEDMYGVTRRYVDRDLDEARELSELVMMIGLSPSTLMHRLLWRGKSPRSLELFQVLYFLAPIIHRCLAIRAVQAMPDH